MGRKDTGPFRVGERVLVPHTDKYYAAKTLKAEKRNDGVFYYLIHYNGWNKKWDEWVEAPGLVKFDPKLAKVNLTEGGRDGGEGPKGAGGPARRSEKKKRPDDINAFSSVHDGAKATSAHPIGLRLDLPPLLKKVLLDDWDRINSDSPAPLPRQPCVQDILQQYVDACHGMTGSSEAEEEIAYGIRVYFDKALRQILLYEQERDLCEKQDVICPPSRGRPYVLSQALADASVPSSIFGGEHLLRLLVKLPELIPPSTMLPETYAALDARLLDFIKFLQRHQSQFFLPPPSSYHSKELTTL